MSDIKKEVPDDEKLKSLNIDSWSPWECEPSEFDWEYAAKETCYVFEGKVKVATLDGDEVLINKGDLVTFPEGLKCRWKVIEKIRKVYRFD